jgi:hypothetical protein
VNTPNSKCILVRRDVSDMRTTTTVSHVLVCQLEPMVTPLLLQISHKVLITVINASSKVEKLVVFIALQVSNWIQLL